MMWSNMNHEAICYIAERNWPNV